MRAVTPSLGLRNRCCDGIAINGLDVAIDGQAATRMALGLHELATNAAKYGALSATGGRVHIDWSVEQGDLSLGWREDGGPPLSGPPERNGFGSRCPGHSIEGQLRGRISQDWRSKGLVIQLVIPLEQLAK